MLWPETEGALRRRLLLLFAGVLALDAVLVVTIDGSRPDYLAFFGVYNALKDDALNVYATVNSGERFGWPYAPGYFPVLMLLGEISEQIGYLDKLIRLPQIAASFAIAWLVQWHLGWRGVSPRGRLIAVALILLHPAVIGVSSMHGQIDPMQWLPAIAAVIAWERLPEGRRAPVAGLLVGLAASIKPPPALVLLALLPLASDWRERGVLAASAAAIPLAALAPFLISDFSSTLNFTDYNGIPGHGGLSLLIQPDLALLRFAGKPVDDFTGAQDLLQDVAPIAVVLVTLAVAVRLWQVRPEPAVGVTFLILGVFVFGGNYFPSYAIWLIPWVVLAGWTRFYWVITALMVVPLGFRYVPARIVDASPFGEGLLYHEWTIWVLYLPFSAALLAVYAWVLLRWLGTGDAEGRSVAGPGLGRRRAAPAPGA